jgi:hypothetical protein
VEANERPNEQKNKKDAEPSDDRSSQKKFEELQYIYCNSKMAEEETDPICECGDTHEDDYYPEQCPKCEKWFVGQCASDNLIYTDDDDSVPCSCLECEKQEEEEEQKKQ